MHLTSNGTLKSLKNIAGVQAATMIGKTAIIGNCNALWNYNDLNALLKPYCGLYLFDRCDITSAPELPATTLSNNCY